MFIAFSMKRTVMEKVLFREEAISELHLNYDPEIEILNHETILTNSSYDRDTFGEIMFEVIGSMVRGEYDRNNGTLYDRIVGILIIILANIVLLNIFIAIIGDAYNEVTTNL